ncbi:hypothetical protein G7K_4198-t1 [Saitoella complicata NRRL Y-17804]|uniref:Ras modification protein ERF4 n=1 Tax=Saitoella complicata (strain BCRC 22490 / CBS 7301 / JCM 7358 / NBRC 10748 / NRRL Y-17804) TaxID=698492 RepID=A0A0E9NJT0_SAICN|nr:hypothetical protein G7K_4198-t1 [Saitoella complicata NRRL Y-17804]
MFSLQKPQNICQSDSGIPHVEWRRNVNSFSATLTFITFTAPLSIFQHISPSDASTTASINPLPHIAGSGDPDERRRATEEEDVTIEPASLSHGLHVQEPSQTTLTTPPPVHSPTTTRPHTAASKSTRPLTSKSTRLDFPPNTHPSPFHLEPVDHTPSAAYRTIRIPAVYSKRDLAPQFSTRFSPLLSTFVEEAYWHDWICHINREVWLANCVTWGTVLWNIVDVASLWVWSSLVERPYKKRLRALEAWIEEENERVWRVAGAEVVSPRKTAYLHLDIEILSMEDTATTSNINGTGFKVDTLGNKSSKNYHSCIRHQLERKRNLDTVTEQTSNRTPLTIKSFSFNFTFQLILP